VDGRVDVPREYVKDNEIVLNIGYGATKQLKIDNEWISFSARFGGVARDIWVPVGNVISIFARESGEGMGFEVELAPDAASQPPVSVKAVEEAKPAAEESKPVAEETKPAGARPHLRVVK
jgi:stringent starvation protein B